MVLDDDETNGLTVSALRGEAGIVKCCLKLFVRDWFVTEVSGGNCAIDGVAKFHISPLYGSLFEPQVDC